MSRFFVNNDKIFDDKVIFSGENYSHLCHVLRAKKGDNVTICDGNGMDFLATIESIDKSKAILKIIKSTKNITEPKIEVTLYFGALKGDKNDLVVQKAVELGAINICPFLSKFVQGKHSIKVDRLNKISYEAAKQCNRGIIPKVFEPTSLNSVANGLTEFDFVLFLCEHEKTQDIKTCLKGIKNFSKTAIIVGSEGGFEESEVELLVQNRACAVTLGNRILRAETASLAALSVLMYEAEQMKL